MINIIVSISMNIWGSFGLRKGGHGLWQYDTGISGVVLGMVPRERELLEHAWKNHELNLEPRQPILHCNLHGPP